VVCHEHVGSPRDWTAEEKSFAASIGDFVSLALEADRRLKAERNLAEREELSRSVAEQMPDALFLLDAEGPVSRIVVRYANQAACRMHGYTVEELVGRPFVILGDPGLATELARRFRQVQVGEEVVFEAVHRRRDGSTFPVEISSQAVHYAGRSSIAVLARDLTQRKQAEQERLDLQRCLLEAERLQSLGMLASGIAHDFGNLLLIIRMHMELIKRESLARRPSSLGSGEKTTDKGQMTKDQALADIEMAVQRAGEMCKALLAYAGKGRQTVASINLSRFAGETVRLLQVTMPAGAVLECELADPLPTIQGDATQLRQVVMNLITNAVEAVRDQAEGGRICIRTGVVGLDETQLKEVVADKKLAPGRYVYLEVSDTGCGMGEETRRRIFEPFFTTKRSGRGLGMAAVLGIVRTHGGGIHVASTPGEGTTVRILFPVPALN
jgi:two-component system cell cycle sensor histidine kinase/response regulator CckA